MFVLSPAKPGMLATVVSTSILLCAHDALKLKQKSNLCVCIHIDLFEHLRIHGNLGIQSESEY